MSMETVPSLKWGIIGCGSISSSFVEDLVIPRYDKSGSSFPPTRHEIVAIGSSSLQKGKDFVAKHASKISAPAYYDSYDDVYADPKVEIVYIGTPHSLHRSNALDAIRAGKHVLCEKPMAINEREAGEMIAAARAKGVFLMEAVWTRFFPVVQELQKMLYQDTILGVLSRAQIDFGLDMPISKMAPKAREADPALGAGALLDIGIYSLTWADIIFGKNRYNESRLPKLAGSAMTFAKDADGKIVHADEVTSVILQYPTTNAQAICTCSMLNKTGDEFGLVEGEHGSIGLCGRATPRATSLAIRLKDKEARNIDFEVEGSGLRFQADAVAQDLREGRTENAIWPLDGTIAMMKMMDEIRFKNGLRYLQDQE